jgi:cellulose synthase/poly-beta-1,6-N-acetylglucosamine synthase-like glycosyltransferase
MSDGSPARVAVAVVPCFNEGNNPNALAHALMTVPDLFAVFVDDGSDPESRRVLDALAQREPRIRVVRNPVRRGKVASLREAFASLDSDTQHVLLADCDVSVPPPTLEMVLDGLKRSDLVLTAPMAIPRARTLWARGAIFSANRHDRLRRAAIDRYPAIFCNGRLLGLSRRMLDAVTAGDIPPHTEDAHFMLVCLDRNYRYAYLDAAKLWYRAPETLHDYLRQTNRFGAGRGLLRERWPEATLARYYDPRILDLASTLVGESLRDPLGALVFAVMRAAKRLQRSGGTQSAAWAVSASTKTVR